MNKGIATTALLCGLTGMTWCSGDNKLPISDIREETCRHMNNIVYMNPKQPNETQIHMQGLIFPVIAQCTKVAPVATVHSGNMTFWIASSLTHPDTGSISTDDTWTVRDWVKNFIEQISPKITVDGKVKPFVRESIHPTIHFNDIKIDSSASSIGTEKSGDYEIMWITPASKGNDAIAKKRGKYIADEMISGLSKKGVYVTGIENIHTDAKTTPFTDEQIGMLDRIAVKRGYTSPNRITDLLVDFKHGKILAKDESDYNAIQTVLEATQFAHITVQATGVKQETYVDVSPWSYVYLLSIFWGGVGAIRRFINKRWKSDNNS